MASVGAHCVTLALRQRLGLSSPGLWGPDGPSWPYPCRLSRDSAGAMARSKNGQAIRESQRTEQKLLQLEEFLEEAVAQSDLATWRRGRAVLGYILGKSVAELTGELDVSLSAVKKWIA